MRLEICAIIKNEARYIEEWLEYHLYIGFDKIWLYDNGSEDDLAGAIAKFDCVEVVKWPERGEQQRTAYQDYLRKNQNSDVWTAFIDADEFIFDASGIGIKNYLSRLPPRCGAVEMPWIIFDCNHHETRPEGLVIENYTRAHSISPQENVKTICRPRHVVIDELRSPHVFNYQPGCLAMFATRDDFPLFHYMLRSKEDVVLKVSRGDVWSLNTERKRLADVQRAVKSILDKYDNADGVEERMLVHASEIRDRLNRRVARWYEKDH